VEPLAGSAGVLVPRRGISKSSGQFATSHGLLLIFDEVILGASVRMGYAFASQYFGRNPRPYDGGEGHHQWRHPYGCGVLRSAAFTTVIDAEPRAHYRTVPRYTYSGHPVGVCGWNGHPRHLSSRRLVRARGVAFAALAGRDAFAARQSERESISATLVLSLGSNSIHAPNEPTKRAYDVFLDCYQKRSSNPAGPPISLRFRRRSSSRKATSTRWSISFSAALRRVH